MYQNFVFVLRKRFCRMNENILSLFVQTEFWFQCSKYDKGFVPNIEKKLPWV